MQGGAPGSLGPIGPLALGPGPWAPENNIRARSTERCMVDCCFLKQTQFPWGSCAMFRCMGAQGRSVQGREGLCRVGPLVPWGQLGPWPWALAPGPWIITLERDQLHGRLLPVPWAPLGTKTNKMPPKAKSHKKPKAAKIQKPAKAKSRKKPIGKTFRKKTLLLKKPDALRPDKALQSIMRSLRCSRRPLRAL